MYSLVIVSSDSLRALSKWLRVAAWLSMFPEWLRVVPCLLPPMSGLYSMILSWIILLYGSKTL